jgi:hypothetical protein
MAPAFAGREPCNRAAQQRRGACHEGKNNRGPPGLSDIVAGLRYDRIDAFFRFRRRKAGISGG